MQGAIEKLAGDGGGEEEERGEELPAPDVEPGDETAASSHVTGTVVCAPFSWVCLWLSRWLSSLLLPPLASPVSAAAGDIKGAETEGEGLSSRRRERERERRLLSGLWFQCVPCVLGPGRSK